MVYPIILAGSNQNKANSMLDIPGSSPLTFSGYYLHENLYESATSWIYRAQRMADQQPVILKILKQPYPPPEKIAWFKREYDITRAMNLAGVIQAYGLENQQHWLMVLEDFGGESLERLKLAGNLPLSNFLRLAIEVSKILGRIHERQIIHKDISPANIVVVPLVTAERGQVKIIDFGSSTAFSRESQIFCDPNVLEGTLAYMSPEQTGQMNRALDYRTDLYSLGATFYELLTGQTPFPTGDPLALIHHHLAILPLPPHALKPDLPPYLAEIIFKLMAKNAEDRYQSAAGLEADLVECLRQWQTKQRIEAFPLGRQDSANRLQLPQRLYGWQAEAKAFLETLLRIVMQNAGARRGCLLLPRTGQATTDQTPATAWLIEAEVTVQPDQATVLQGIPLKPWPATSLPFSLINYVTRTQEAVVLDDGVGMAPFAHDPYLLACRPQSALGLPLVSRGRLRGLLYLENGLAKGVFTPERLELLKYLVAMAAIAIENTLLAAPPPASVTPRPLADLPPSFFIPTTGQTLTRREIEIIALLAAGATNRAIAMQLIISRDTVKTHLKNIFTKLAVTSRQQAIAHARELGLL